MKNNSTISAKDARAELALYMNDMSTDLDGHDDYICDAVSEVADSWVSVYTRNQVAYCRENSSSVRDVLAEGLALAPADFFKANPNADYEDYEAHIGACAWYHDNETAIYDDLGDALYYVGLGELARRHGDALDRDAWESVSLDVNDYDTFGEAVEAADAQYTEALTEEKAA